MAEKKTDSKKKIKPINIHNNQEMIENGFVIGRYPRKVYPGWFWQKSPKEKKALRKAKYSCINKNSDWHISLPPKKRPTVKAKLIIYLKRNKISNKNVISIECYDTQIPNYLERYKKGDKNYVIKYSFNGKTYAA